MNHRPHVPVLTSEVLRWLDPRPGGTYVDATVGAGGHAGAILERIRPGGRLIGLDRDADALAVAAARLRPDGARVALRHRRFAELARALADEGIETVDGIVFDFGVSSMQLDDPARGFSFAAEGPLDMRMDRAEARTAGDLVNSLPERDLADLLYHYGDERLSRRIARAIVRARPLRTTTDLAAAVARAVPRGARPRGIHPATRTFQALRIAVNRELEEIEAALPQALDLLRPGGRIVAISFHSLEDRLVKQAFRGFARAGAFRILTAKPVTPTPDELAANPRARSAKLRAGERAEAAA